MKESKVNKPQNSETVVLTKIRIGFVFWWIMLSSILRAKFPYKLALMISPPLKMMIILKHET